MDRKTEHIIFFSALIVIGVGLVGGVAYFKAQGGSDSLLADVSANIPLQYQVPTTTIAVETIPTSTIITTIIPTSSVPLVPLTLPYFYGAQTATASYWPKAWGDVMLTDTSLGLIPDPTHRGANSFLQGAGAWTNYVVSANVSPLMGGWFDVVSRVSSNTQNFVYCEFGPNGTEAIERINGVDTQLAATSASTTNADGTENFGMEVYGNDIGCTIAGTEILGARVSNNGEEEAGGIGFVIFGAPPAQSQVAVSDISVTQFPDDDIVVPFPVAVVPPPPAPTPPPPGPTSTPVTPPPTLPPVPVVTTTTKALPYVINDFSRSQGWNTYWGTFSIAKDGLIMAAGPGSTSAGALLSGTDAWDNYTFTAKLDWIKGETFGLYARYTDAQNYVLCYFDEINPGTIQISLEQHINGTEYTLEQGQVQNYDRRDNRVTAAINVYNSQGSCSFNDNVISSAGSGYTLNPPYSGSIGFSSFDPSNGNAEIIVRNINVQPAVN